MLDAKKARELDCDDCNSRMQVLRNCDGKGPPAKIDLNDQLYRRCPRAVYLENTGLRFVVNSFIDCRKQSILPYPGGPMVQTYYTMQVFEYLEGIIQTTQAKHQAKASQEAAKPVKPRR